jgi:hypothetical protein
MPKGEKLIGQSKRTVLPPCFLKTFYLSNWYYCICKNPLDSQEEKTYLCQWENLFRGSFYLAKGKALEKGGESFKIRNAFENFIPTP